MLVPAAFVGTAFINVTAMWSSSTYLPAIVSGSVVGTANAVVPGAAVSLWRGAVQVNATTTDGQGRFAFGSVAAGTYALRVQASGYGPYARNVTTAGDGVVDVGALRLVAPVPTGGLTGRVVDANGNGIASATLRLVAGAVTVATARSNSTGSFRFSNVPVGSYQLFINATGYRDANLSVTITAAQVADVGSISLQALPAPPADMSWALWVSAAAVVVAVGLLVAWRFLRNRRRPPRSEESTEPPASDDRTLK